MSDRLKELAKQAGVISGFKDLHSDMIKFAELIRQDEREACAQVCDDWLVGRDDICEVAKAIRARGTT